jgi:ubiquinol-cytochrome c reductase cytochrome b subunit
MPAPRMRKLGDWLDVRTGHRALVGHALGEQVLGGASFAYAAGSVLTFVILLQMITGVLLAMGYSASSTDAWASVAYIQDQVSFGWFVRGLHAHGASAAVIVAGLHMFQTALYGAYKRPRELNWIVGVLMLGLLLAFALTGYLLPWDQTGYWATKVATGIAGTAPVAGAAIQQAMQGGNEYGNLTLTRFFALHVLVLPAVLIGLVVFHLALFRKHGVTPHWKRSAADLQARARPFWPDQLFRDMVAIVVTFAAIVLVNLSTHGAKLDGPADPSSSFDARPEWYFRPLFQALKYFEGTAEQIVALGLPVVLGGILIGIPFLDRGAERSPAVRWRPLLVLGLVGALTAGLTVVSFREDAADPDYQAAVAAAEQQATRARALAVEHGVPPAGGTAVFTTEPLFAARARWQASCAACHEGDARKGPAIGPGYNSRAWIAAFLRDPSGARFFGVTPHDGMKPVELQGDDFAAIVELVYAQTGAPDIDRAKLPRGETLFDDECSGCHSIDATTEGDPGPNLGGRGSLDGLAAFIGQPGHPRWFGGKSVMPPFADELNRAERRELAAYLISLRDLAPPPAP